jgi:CO dehydrogenase maturation factor
VCPEHVLIRRLISHLVLKSDEVVIMDMEAGIEHLGRGTASSVDQFIVVIEPGARSIQTYEKVKKLAHDLGVEHVRVVANKVRDEFDESFIKENIPENDLLGFVHYNQEVIDADRLGKSPFDFSESAIYEIRLIKEKIDKEFNERGEINDTIRSGL